MEEKTGKYDKDDAAKDTESSIKQVSSAWHQARDDSGARQAKDVEQFKSPPDWAEKTTEKGIPLFPKDKE